MGRTPLRGCGAAGDAVAEKRPQATRDRGPDQAPEGSEVGHPRVADALVRLPGRRQSEEARGLRPLQRLILQLLGPLYEKFYLLSG